jgi:hypothetical protein
MNFIKQSFKVKHKLHIASVSALTTEKFWVRDC